MPEQQSFSGPFVQIACICQVPLAEANGSMSLIRIQDRVQVIGSTPQMQPQPLQNLVMVVMLKSGSLRETHQLKIVTVTPSGKRYPLTEVSALFEGDDRGVGLVIPVAVVATEEGPYWFEILVEDQMLTKIPLRVLYQRAPIPPQQPPMM